MVFRGEITVMFLHCGDNNSSVKFFVYLLLHNLYSPPSTITSRMIKSRRIRWAGHVARIGETWNAYRILEGKPEEKIPLVKPRRR
jgi:hypothetical protein